jgi:hypothetical protein
MGLTPAPHRTRCRTESQQDPAGMTIRHQRQFAAARAAVQHLMDRYPAAVEPRMLLSHALWQEGIDWPAAERALQAVLALAPSMAKPSTIWPCCGSIKALQNANGGECTASTERMQSECSESAELSIQSRINVLSWSAFTRSGDSDANPRQATGGRSFDPSHDTTGMCAASSARAKSTMDWNG